MESQLAASSGQPRVLHHWASTGCDAGSPVNTPQEGLGQEQLTIGPIKHIEEPVAIGVKQYFGGLAFINGVDQHIGLGGIPIRHVVGRESEIPSRSPLLALSARTESV